MITDELSNYYADFLDRSYNCVHRVVLNSSFGMGAIASRLSVLVAPAAQRIGRRIG